MDKKNVLISRYLSSHKKKLVINIVIQANSETIENVDTLGGGILFREEYL